MTTTRVSRIAGMLAAVGLVSALAVASPMAAAADDPAGSISGTVVGGYIEYGEGRAQAYRLVDGSWHSEAGGDIAADGTYAIEGLPAGTYRVSFTDLAGVGWDDAGNEYRSWREWWNDRTTRGTASDIVLTDAVAIPHIDVDLDSVGGAPTWPALIGTPRVGQTLTATPGVWPDGIPLAYEWYADDSYLEGQDGATLTLTTAMIGRSISVVVWGQKEPGEWEGKDSDATAPVQAAVLAAPTPTVSGVLAVGSTVQAVAGTWTPGAKLAYQWYASGTPIGKATASTFRLTSAQQGKSIAVKVTGTLSGYPAASRTSKATGKVALAAVPTIAGTAAVGAKLTAKVGTWTSGTALSYQWYADGVAVGKATKSTFTIAAGQRGKAMTVTVTGKKSGYATVAKTSKATLRVPTTTTPKISGSPTVTRTLTVAAGTWTPGAKLSYQWYANGSAIKGATSSRLTLSAAHAGKRITVKVTGRQAGYTTVSKTASATKAVGYPTRTAPSSSWNCPAWAPIKGNADSGIYHLPGQRFYQKTKPEECFRTESAAKAAGYRKSKV